MTNALPHALVISASSDIGAALLKDWIGRGWSAYGTYRTSTPWIDELQGHFGVPCVYCDLLDSRSVQCACERLVQHPWDALVFAPGFLEPIGNFSDVSFDRWEENLEINLLQPLRILHALLPARNRRPALPEVCVLFFAGGGVNNAVPRYSSYTLAKIALIKMCELLDAEMPDVRFVIVGPGCVDTKIHEPTLRLGPQVVGANYQRTLDRLRTGECIPMDRVVACCTWLVTTPSRGVRGRNVSVAQDAYSTSSLEHALEENPHMYKLRRSHNTWTHPEDVRAT